MLEETGFGYIIADGRRYGYDIVLFPDGEIRRRRKDLSRKYKGRYGHTPLSLEELEQYIGKAGDIEYLVIGTGQYGVLPLTPEAREYLKELERRGVKVIADKTPNILSTVNELKKKNRRILAIIHVTC